MNDLINLLTSKEIIIVYIVVGVACFLYFVIYLIDKSYCKRKQRQNTRELNKLVDDINATLALEEQPSTENINIVEPVTYVEPILVKEEQPEEVMPIENIEPKVEEVQEVETKPSEIVETKEEVEVENLVLDTMDNNSEEEIKYTSIEPNPREAQEELRRLAEELEKAEAETQNIDLTSYEEAQERDAIISLDELIEKSKEMYANNELTQYEDEGNEPISLADLEAKMQKASVIEEEAITYPLPVMEPIVTPETLTEEKVNEQMVLDDFTTVKVEPVRKPAYQETTKYKPSPIISPIYGIEKEPSQTDLELENTANYEKLDEEIKKTNEFIMTLKELQKHLD